MGTPLQPVLFFPIHAQRCVPQWLHYARKHHEDSFPRSYSSTGYEIYSKTLMTASPHQHPETWVPALRQSSTCDQ